jgi:hypothetical protein
MQDLHLTRFVPESSPAMAVHLTGCEDEQDSIDGDTNCDRAIEIWQFCLLTLKCTE